MRPIFPWYIPIQRTLETPFGSFHGPSLPNMTNCHRQFHPVRNETRALTTGSTTGLVLLWQLTGGPETSRSLNVWQRKEKKKKSLLFPFQSQIIEETKGKTKRNHWPKTMHLSRARQSGTPCFLLPVPPSLWVPPPASCLALEGTGANSQRFHYGIRLSLLLWKMLCWRGFILKAALLFVEYPERLKFGDGSLMGGTNVCVVSNYCCSIWMAFLFCPHRKNHMEGWFWSHTRLSLNETMRMIAGILIFFH